MMELTTVKGIVIKRNPVSEYDQLVTILTADRGKITAFAKGARRPGNHLSGAVEPFCFGEFRLFTGRTSYNIQEAVISNFFESFRQDLDGAMYGTYFMELADYYARENNNEYDLLKLLYQSLRALENSSFDNRLVRCVYEIKTLQIEGEFPGLPTDRAYENSTKYAVDFIAGTKVEKLYTFKVTDDVLLELMHITDIYRKHFIDRKLKSMEMIEMIEKGQLS